MVRGSAKQAVSRARGVLFLFCSAALCSLAIPAASFASSAPSIGAVTGSGSENYATLEVPIRPNGLETRYEFWLQYPACTSGGSCEPATSERVGEGSIEASRLEQVVSVNLTSLKWNYSYSFVVTATNEDGRRESYPQTFTTPSSPPAGDPGGSGAGAPYEFKEEPWNEAGASREADEAPQLEAERQAKAKEEAERPAEEAAARAAKERAVREAGERAGREAAEREAKMKEAEKTAAASSVRCLVPRLRGDSLAAARSALSKAHCGLGKVNRARKEQRKLVVSTQSVRAGRVLAKGTAVAVKLGPARS